MVMDILSLFIHSLLACVLSAAILCGACRNSSAKDESSIVVSDREILLPSFRLLIAKEMSHRMVKKAIASRAETWEEHIHNGATYCL